MTTENVPVRIHFFLNIRHDIMNRNVDWLMRKLENLKGSFILAYKFTTIMLIIFIYCFFFCGLVALGVECNDGAPRGPAFRADPPGRGGGGANKSRT